MARYARLHAANEGKFSVDTFASFDLYCHYVAGLVGEGLSALFAASGKEAPELGDQLTLSNSMGLMLQKTNILRDFREDTDEGRVFWPAEIWKKYVDRPEDLYAPGNEEKAMWALSEMTVDALTHATDALDYLTLLTNQSIFNFCAIPQVMAVATLDLCFMNPKVMKQNIKIRKGYAVSVRPFLSSSVRARADHSLCLQLILGATNPRDVAYIFRDHLRRIHARARANDPSFIKIAVLAGRVRSPSSFRRFHNLTLARTGRAMDRVSLPLLRHPRRSCSHLFGRLGRRRRRAHQAAPGTERPYSGHGARCGACGDLGSTRGDQVDLRGCSSRFLPPSGARTDAWVCRSTSLLAYSFVESLDWSRSWASLGLERCGSWCFAMELLTPCVVPL